MIWYWLIVLVGIAINDVSVRIKTNESGFWLILIIYLINNIQAGLLSGLAGAAAATAASALLPNGSSANINTPGFSASVNSGYPYGYGNYGYPPYGYPPYGYSPYGINPYMRRGLILRRVGRPYYIQRRRSYGRYHG